MIQKFTVEDKFSYSIYDPQTLVVETLKPYKGIRHIEYQIEPSELIFKDDEPTRLYAIEKYKEIVKAIETVKKYQIEYTVLYDLYQKIEAQIWSEIEDKKFNGTTGRNVYAEKVRNGLQFFYNDLFRHFFSIEGNVEESPYYIQPYLLFQIINKLNHRNTQHE